MKKMIVILCLALLGVMALPSAASAATLSQRVRALEKAVAAIKTVNKQQTTKINNLTTQLTAAQGTIASLTTDMTAAQTKIAGLTTDLTAVMGNNALDLGPYVSVTSNTLEGVIGPNIVFQGANVHVRSTTSLSDGSHLGNLIVGWNNQASAVRTGDNNLVVGFGNSFTASGGFVAGFQCGIGSNWSTVTGGILNNARTNVGASVSGGYGNTASGYASSVSGGDIRTATGSRDWVAGALFQDN